MEDIASSDRPSVFAMVAIGCDLLSFVFVRSVCCVGVRLCAWW
jgi:hypothetical protein